MEATNSRVAGALGGEAQLITVNTTERPETAADGLERRDSE